MGTRTPRWAGMLLAVAVWLCVVGAEVRADDEGRVGPQEMASRRSALRSAGGKYITHRKRFPSRCPVCGGAGKRRVRRGRGFAVDECKQCVGKGVWLSKDDYREVYYDLRTPAFRGIPDIKDVLGKQYDQARRGNPWPLFIQRYRLTDWEMVDATHGIVWFKYNAAKVATATYWVYAPDEDGKRREWYVYDARSDGAWPSEGERVAPGGSAAGDALGAAEALPADCARLLRMASAHARATFRVVESGERGGVLQLTLEPGLDAQERPTYERIELDAVRLMRAIMAEGAPWSRVEAEWRDEWRDAYGRTALRPRWLSALDQPQATRTPWDTLTLREQAQRVALVALTHDGWEPVHSDAPPAPAPAAPVPAPPFVPESGPRPAPGPETPEPPSPAPPEPTAPPPGPPTPPPAPPTAPPPTAPSNDELPDLTAKAKRAAEKGLAEIRAALKAAADAFNDGVTAHQGGAMDLWQEKLSEARAHLAEIKEIWYGEILPEMPGADEAEQDAVANENFGEIWDEISKLESMVRKLSRGT